MESCGGGQGDTGVDTPESGWWSNFVGLDDFGNYVGGLIGTAISALISPLNAISNAFDVGLNALGEALNGLGSSIGSWFDNVGEWFSELDEGLSIWFDELGNGIASWFTSLIDNMTGWFEDLPSNMLKLLNWFNPLSEDFFLKVAFVPDTAFMQQYTEQFDGLLKTKFGFFFQLVDTFKAMSSSIGSQVGTWDGIQIDLSNYGIGELDIVSGYAIQQYGEKMRFWIGGIMIFFTSAWLIRKLSGVLGEGK